MMDMLKTVYPPKSMFCAVIIRISLIAEQDSLPEIAHFLSKHFRIFHSKHESNPSNALQKLTLSKFNIKSL